MKKTAILIIAVTFGMIGGAWASEPTQAQLQKEAKISWHHARVIALKQVSHGTIRSGELEREHGILIYSFDIHSRKGITEVNVDAKNGKVVAVQHESAAAEAAEKKTEHEKH